MKFVIDNYSDNNNTQALYLHQHIEENKDHEVYMNTFDYPVYEVMSQFNPNVYITSCNTISKDLFLFMKEHQRSTGVKLIINTDDCKVAHIQQVYSKLKENKIEFKLFGNMNNKHIPSSIISKSFRILNCTDVNITKNQDPRLDWHTKIDSLIFIDSKDQLEKINIKDKTYHIACPSSNITNDISFDIVGMCKNIIHNYDKVIFCNLDSGFSQQFFESLYRANKTYFYSEDPEKINESLSKILKCDVNLNVNDNRRQEDFTNIKQIVAAKHTSANRTVSLLSQLPQKI